MSRFFCSFLRAMCCTCWAESCSEPAPGIYAGSLGVGPDGIRRMWCGSQVVTWPLPVLFMRMCLSLSDSTPVRGWEAPDNDGKSLLIFDVASLVAHMVKKLPATRETQVRSLGREDPLEKQMATHSSILAWKIPWTEEPCRLQSMGSRRVRND